MHFVLCFDPSIFGACPQRSVQIRQKRLVAYECDMPAFGSVAIVHEAISGGAVFVATFLDVAKNCSCRYVDYTILDVGFLHEELLVQWVVRW